MLKDVKGMLPESNEENYYDMCDCIEDVYGGAYWAIRYGATRESLIDQIDEAIELVQDELKTGRLSKER